MSSWLLRKTRRVATAENQAGQGHFGLDLDGFLFAGQLGCCDSREIIERQSVCVVDVARRGEAENSSVVARKEEERNNNNNGSSNNNSNTHTTAAAAASRRRKEANFCVYFAIGKMKCTR